MAISQRDGIAAIAAFLVAWFAAGRWLPALQYLSFAFILGAAFGILGLFAAIALTGREWKHIRRTGRTADTDPRALSFLARGQFATEKRDLKASSAYESTSLYPKSRLVSDKLDELVDLSFRDFIRSWYIHISPRSCFANEVERSIRSAWLGIHERLMGLDVVEFGVSQLVPLVTGHLREFYLAERAVRGKHLTREVTESDELDLAIASKYRDGRLHQAVSLASSDLKLSQQDHLRRTAERLLPELMPEDQARSRVVCALVIEIVTCAILAPLMQLLSDPDTWNHLIEAYGQSMLQDRKSVRKLREALEEHASPNSKAKRAVFPRLAPNDSERRYERFIRAIRTCNNISDARRFRSEVSSQLKRDVQASVQDPVYLKRLEIAKRMLDQRVSRLGSGEAAPNRPIHKRTNSSWIEQASLPQILRDSAGVSYFMEFMDRQKLMDLVQFWIIVDGLRGPLEDDLGEDEDIPATLPSWTDTDKSDIALIERAYLSKAELNVPEHLRRDVRSFLKAGVKATPSQYFAARQGILRTQTAALREMQDRFFPKFKQSDIYYKYLASSEASDATNADPFFAPAETDSRNLGPESHSVKPLPVSREALKPPSSKTDLRRAALSATDLRAAGSVSPQRRSFDNDSTFSAPLFPGDEDVDPLSRSRHSIESEPGLGDSTQDSNEKVVQAMESALNDILVQSPTLDDRKEDLFSSADTSFLSSRDDDSARSSLDLLRPELAGSKDREKPNLKSLGLVNAASRIGVFSDDDLFGDEAKFPEDDYEDHEEDDDDKSLDGEIHEAAPGDLGLAEAISSLTADVDKLHAQDNVIDSLTKKAELTNNNTELRILRKSKASLQREVRRKELQRQQYIVQESDSSLFGRSSTKITSVVVGTEDDGHEYALYMIEVKRRAGEQLTASAWVIARRYSEFHDLHRRLRSKYPSVRNMDFPRRRVVMTLQSTFLRKRRQALEKYLQELLLLPDVCQSRDLRAFLSQQAIGPAAEDRNGSSSNSRQDLLRRLYNSVTDGVDELFGNIPILEQFSLAGQGILNSAHPQLNPMPPSLSSDPATAAEAEAELKAFERANAIDGRAGKPSPTDSSSARESPVMEAGPEPFVKPICDVFLEAFSLNRGNNWLRGRAVVIVLHQLLGGTIERKVRDHFKTLTQDDSILKGLGILEDTVWPLDDDQNHRTRRQFKPRTSQEKSKTCTEASLTLATLVPELASGVVGRGNAQAASRRIFATLNNERLNAHLVFTLFDEIIEALFGKHVERTTTSHSRPRPVR